MVSAIDAGILQPYGDQDKCWACGLPTEGWHGGQLCLYCAELCELRAARSSKPGISRGTGLGLSVFGGISSYWAEESNPHAQRGAATPLGACMPVILH